MIRQPFLFDCPAAQKSAAAEAAYRRYRDLVDWQRRTGVCRPRGGAPGEPRDIGGGAHRHYQHRDRTFWTKPTRRGWKIDWPAIPYTNPPQATAHAAATAYATALDEFDATH